MEIDFFLINILKSSIVFIILKKYTFLILQYDYLELKFIKKKSRNYHKGSRKGLPLQSLAVDLLREDCFFYL